MQMLKADMQRAFFFCFLHVKNLLIKDTSLLCSLWPCEREHTPFRKAFHALSFYLLKTLGNFGTVVHKSHYLLTSPPPKVIESDSFKVLIVFKLSRGR